MVSVRLLHRAPAGRGHPLAPTTRLGTAAVRLALAFVVLTMAWRLMGPLGGFPGFVCGIVAGVLALVAILGRGDRSLAVRAAVLPLALVVLFVASELLAGHD